MARKSQATQIQELMAALQAMQEQAAQAPAPVPVVRAPPANLVAVDSIASMAWEAIRKAGDQVPTTTKRGNMEYRLPNMGGRYYLTVGRRK